MRTFRTLLAGIFVFGALLHAQEPMDLSPEADAADESLLKETLYVSVSAEDVYRSEDVQALVERQAELMLEASRRRMDRQERRVAELKAGVEAGRARHQDLKDAVAEMNRRIEVGYLAISRSAVLRDVVQSARNEALRPQSRFSRGRVARFAGRGVFTAGQLRQVEMAFLKRFGRRLPVSAHGDTALHRALGFDHSGRVDVAVAPDQPEGVFLRALLEKMRVPYYAFRTAVPGSATAPHIHIGPGSTRIYRRAGAGPGRPVTSAFAR